MRDRRVRNRGGRAGTRFRVGSQSGDIDNIGRDQHIYYDSDAASLEQLRRAGPALKALFVVAVLLSVAGLVVFAVGVFGFGSELPDVRSPSFEQQVRDFGRVPPPVILGGGLFLTGFVLTAVASVILALKRRD